MNKRDTRNHFKQSLVVVKVAYCKTILQVSVRFVLSSILVVSMVSCGPGGGTTINNQYLTNQGSDKKLPDDDGYTGSGGTGDGGGGQGISCSADTSVEKLRGKILLRDIYEAIYNSNLTAQELNSEEEESISPDAYDLVAANFKKYYGPAYKQFDTTDPNFWRAFSKKIFFLDGNKALTVSSDANSPILLPKGCKIVQIAFWSDSNSEGKEDLLYVDKQYWNKLDQVNKVALLAHELLFKDARLNGYKSSDYIRSKVGALFSTKGLDPIFKNWISNSDSRFSQVLPKSSRGFKACVGKSSEDPSANLNLIQYEGKDKLQHIVITKVKSSFFGLSDLDAVEMSFDPAKNPVLSKVSDLMLLMTDYRTLASRANDNPSYFDLEYGELVLLSELTVSDKESILDIDLLKLSDQPNDIWKTFFKTPYGPIKFSIKNPGKGFSKSSELKTPNKIIEAIKKKIFEEIVDASAGTYWHGEKQAVLYQAFAILEKEIQDGVSQAIYPVGFPKWNTALAEIEKLFAPDETIPGYIKVNNRSKIKKMVGNKYLNQDLPAILMKARLGFTEWAELERLKIDAYDVLETSGSYGNVNITVSLSTQDSISFNLECESFEEIYVKELHPPNLVLENRKDLTTEFDPYIFISTRAELKDDTIPSISRLLNYLRKVSKESREHLKEKLPDHNFANDLKNNQTLVVLPCMERTLSLENKIRTLDQYTLCTIIHLKETNTFYITQFNYNSDSDSPYYFYFKQITPVSPKRKAWNRAAFHREYMKERSRVDKNEQMMNMHRLNRKNFR